jgi:hypothetical protein
MKLKSRTELVEIRQMLSVRFGQGFGPCRFLGLSWI